MAERTLREEIEEFLKREILSKPEEERTKRDEMLLVHGRAFADVLLRHEAARNDEPQPHEAAMVSLLKGYNEVNRRYDLRNIDAELATQFREPRR